MNEEELIDIMDCHGAYLLKIAYIYVKNWETAEEIVQDVFVKYYEKSAQFEGRSTLRTYLVKMTINRSSLVQLSAHSKQAVLNRTTGKENRSTLNKQLKPKQMSKNTLMPMLVLISFIIRGFSVYYISYGYQSIPLNTGSTTPMLTEEEIKKELLSLSSEAFTYLEKGDMFELGQLVDSIEGISFAFYADEQVL